MSVHRYRKGLAVALGSARWRWGYDKRELSSHPFNTILQDPQTRNRETVTASLGTRIADVHQGPTTCHE
ncbi:hypothetical protein CGLO_10037 [Colletotrichum gloeosporioides Cg-14]|uniref:Uncharacterized protein n=1 Tax=Colletotrichum gloeosporioides (strain Cg-14) TaxID=1237896 RepID=T0K4Y6_COLGC|nr:hypothetical protein CGLO_10037 [Colletotrichum gloeosporioides Cg-14]